MRFDFPKNTTKVSVSIRVDEVLNNKIRRLAELNNCFPQDIYTVLLSEAIEDYELQSGPIVPKKEKPHYVDTRHVETVPEPTKTDEDPKVNLCANLKCDTPKMKFRKCEMAEYKGNYYCSPDCANLVAKGITNKFMSSTPDF